MQGSATTDSLPLASPLRARLRCERAIALPMALMVITVTTIIAGAAVRAGIMSTSQTGRDSEVKRALQASAAGIKAALFQLNMMQPSDSQCVRPDGTGQLEVYDVNADGWCDAISEQIDDQAQYTQQTSDAREISVNGQILAERDLVSTGTVNGVMRRVHATATSLKGSPLLPDNHAIVSLDSITLSNSVHIDGDVASNGDITISNYSDVCGNVRPGPGQTVTFNNNGTLCAGYSVIPATTSYILDPVDQGNVATVNDNGRIGVEDTWTDPGSIAWDPTTRRLSMSGQSTLTLTGNVYSFCRLDMSNSSSLQIATRNPGTAVRIYIDSPENCSGSGAGSVSAANSSSIVNLNSEPTTLQLYLAGSPTQSTSATFANSFTTTLPMVIYAPRSTVTFSNGGTIRGAIAAKTINLSNSVQVIWDPDAGTLSTSSVFRIYHRQEWVECTSKPTGSAPDSGC